MNKKIELNKVEVEIEENVDSPVKPKYFVYYLYLDQLHLFLLLKLVIRIHHHLLYYSRSLMILIMKMR